MLGDIHHRNRRYTMTEGEATRVAVLADWPLPKLREYEAGFGSDTKPSRAEIRLINGNKSRGELILSILWHEGMIPYLSTVR
jgi:hypothetical protein